MAQTAALRRIHIPEFGIPTNEVALPAGTYVSRWDRLRAAARGIGVQTLVVYGDREHMANIAYICGYDPRFEEALFIINVDRPDARPVLVVGNEGMGYVPASPVRNEMDAVLYQPFSLLGQDRSQSPPLREIIAHAGIERGTKVAVAGWKYFSDAEFAAPERRFEVPSYIVETLREITGGVEQVCNATRLFMANTGLRAQNELEQLAAFEHAACFASTFVKRVLFGARPGMSERDACALMGLNGFPLSCHVMLSAGERAAMGLPSPSMRRIEAGDPITTAVGLWGALTSRAGFMVANAAELPEDRRDYVERLVAPYFGAVKAWYETVGIGTTGGELYEAIHSRIGDPFFGVGLNPGHLIHLDEWVNSPIYKGSTEKLASGMALQVDVIPATGTRYYTSNIEDGIALADDPTREAFAARYPDAWARIEARRRFMAEELGIRLKPEVLPFSNIPAYLPPFWLSADLVMAVG